MLLTSTCFAGRGSGSRCTVLLPIFAATKLPEDSASSDPIRGDSNGLPADASSNGNCNGNGRGNDIADIRSDGVSHIDDECAHRRFISAFPSILLSFSLSLSLSLSLFLSLSLSLS